MKQVSDSYQKYLALTNFKRKQFSFSVSQKKNNNKKKKCILKSFIFLRIRIKLYLHVNTALNSDTSSGEKRTVKEASSPDRIIPSDGSTVNGISSVPRIIPKEYI